MNKDNNFLHSIIEGTTDAIFSKDLQGRYVMINSAGARFIGKPVEEIIGTADMELFSPDTAQKIIELDRDIMATGKTKTLEEIATSNDFTRTYFVTKFPYCDQNGNIIGLIGIARDITERKQAEEKIKKLNESLEQRIAKRTSELAKVNEKLRLEIVERKNIEKEIRQAKNYSESLISNSIDMIISVNTNRKIVIFNPAAEKTFGYKKEEVLGKHVQILYADSSQSLQVHKTTMNTSEFDGEVLNKKKDGSTFISHLASTVLRDEKGVIIGFMGISRDITERKRAEKALREAEERLRMAMSAAEMGTWKWDTVTNQDTRDANFNRILGLEAAESTQPVEDFIERVHPEDRAAVDQEIKRSIRERDIYLAEFRIVRPDGSERWLRDQGLPFYDKQDMISYMTGAVVDITEHKRMEDALKESEEKFRAVFEQAADSVVVIDADTGEIVEFNDLAHKNLGYTREEFKNIKIADIDVVESHEDVIRHLEKVMKKGGDVFETKHVAKNGEIRDMLISARVISIRGEKLISGIWRDITERKKTEEMLQGQKKALEQKNIALSEVLGQIEIEKKQIKDNVITNAENLLLPIIQKLRLTGESRKYVQLLRKNLQELTSSFGKRLTEKEAKLTSREVEICNMVKNGLTSKEIASLLNISFLTIEKHRINIRRKLGIINKDINLTSFLKTF